MTGEPYFLREPGMLESALMRPRNHWNYGERDMALLAGSLLLGINRNHPFEQGNKRTALAATSQFLRANGYTLTAPDGVPLGEFILRSAAGTIAHGTFIKAFSKCFVPTEEWEEYASAAE